MLQIDTDYRSGSDFEDPFYVIMHFDPDIDPSYLDRGMQDYRRVLLEIETIRQEYDHLFHEGDEREILPDVPQDRPILVCGFFDGVCVQIQTEALERSNYEAYVSREGTY